MEGPRAIATERDAARRARLEALYRAHHRSMVRLAWLLLEDQGLAEELVQDAFVRLYGALDGIRDPDREVAYLRSIVMNLARDGLRRRGVARRHLARVDPLDALDGPAADASTLVAEDARTVLGALRELPPRQREALVLRFYGECSVGEIAAAMDISTGAVKAHLFKARQAMAAVLGEQREHEREDDR